jgi:adenosyl cobinamide kinase/adenosyl cobinamide phosphate guanylyltransferase
MGHAFGVLMDCLHRMGLAMSGVSQRVMRTARLLLLEDLLSACQGVAQRSLGALVVVSNEVGWGIVPPDSQPNVTADNYRLIEPAFSHVSRWVWSVCCRNWCTLQDETRKGLYR